MHSMDLLGDMDHVESRFSPFRDSVSVGAQALKSTSTRSSKIISEPMVHSSHTMHLTCVRISTISKRTTCFEIVLDAPDGTSR
jgi:hypothetical protein